MNQRQRVIEILVSPDYSLSTKHGFTRDELEMGIKDPIHIGWNLITDIDDEYNRQGCPEGFILPAWYEALDKALSKS